MAIKRSVLASGEWGKMNRAQMTFMTIKTLYMIV